MARQNRAANPSQDNRSQMMTQGNFAEPGYPDPSAIEASAVESNPGEVMSMGNPTLPAIDETTGQFVEAQPTPQPEQTPAPAQPAPAPEVEVDSVTARFRAMSPDQLVEQAANLERLRGKHAEEVGTYRKLFDKFMEGGLPGAPQHQPVPQPTPVVEDESALVTEILTSPKKFMEKVEAQVMGKLEQQQRQAMVVQEFKKHEAVITSPQFQAWEKNVPQSLIEQAKSDPRTLNWIVTQYQGMSGQSGQATPTQPVATQTQQPTNHRVVPLGVANGGPSAATRPDTTKPTYTRAELARLMLEKPDEYRAREEEINQAYLEGRIR